MLGEGVLWNEQLQYVCWTDIEQSKLYRYQPRTGTLSERDMPHRVACCGFIEGRDDLIVAFDCGIAIYDIRARTLDWVVEPGFLPDGVRFNDGKIDPQGRFWVGTLVEDPDAGVQAALYCLGRDGQLEERISDLTISNGLCWSPDGSVMYHTDSPTGRIDAYRFDAACVSPSGGYAVIYERLGTKGLLLRDGVIVREIDRSFYHASDSA